MKNKKEEYKVTFIGMFAIIVMLIGISLVSCSSAKCVQDEVIKIEDANFERRGHKYYKVTYKSGCVIYTQDKI